MVRSGQVSVRPKAKKERKKEKCAEKEAGRGRIGNRADNQNYQICWSDVSSEHGAKSRTARCDDDPTKGCAHKGGRKDTKEQLIKMLTSIDRDCKTSVRSNPYPGMEWAGVSFGRLFSRVKTALQRVRPSQSR